MRAQRGSVVCVCVCGECCECSGGVMRAQSVRD